MFFLCGIKFMHEHEDFREKPLEANGRRSIREGKERSPPGYFVHRALKS